MTSLIGGAIYLGHKKYIEHRYNKRKQVNFERWEDLRDNHEEEQKSRSSLNLDERPAPSAARGRTSAWDEELPAQLKVERRSFQEDSSVRRPWEDRVPSETRSKRHLTPERAISETRSERYLTPERVTSGGSDGRSQRNLSAESVNEGRSTPPVRTEVVEPESWHTPGGFMAELIERGK